MKEKEKPTNGKKNPKGKKRSNEKRYKHICPIDGKIFYTARPKADTCSDKCRKKKSKMKKAEEKQRVINDAKNRAEKKQEYNHHLRDISMRLPEQEADVPVWENFEEDFQKFRQNRIGTEYETKDPAQGWMVLTVILGIVSLSLFLTNSQRGFFKMK